jgi:hypothetical protein
MKTAVCLSGKLDAIESHRNLLEQVIEPYKADVFIDSWIPFGNNSIQSCWTEEDYKNAGFEYPPKPQNIQEYAEAFQPKMMVLDNFDTIPLNHQIRSVLPKSKMTAIGVESLDTKTENVLFMWYKIWKANQLRKLYEQANRIRYDCIIRLRFDSTFKDNEFPVIDPKRKTVYIPYGGDYEGGICDQVAIADPTTMDLYCEMYNEIYRYTTAKIGIHPESMLRKHLEINRLNVERFECQFALRGKLIPKSGKLLFLQSEGVKKKQLEDKIVLEHLKLTTPSEILRPGD